MTRKKKVVEPEPLKPISLGEGMLWELEGTQYKVTGFTKDVRDGFIEFMRFHELDALKKQRTVINPATGEPVLSDDDYYTLLTRHISMSGYNHKWGSEHFWEVVSNPDNLCELLQYAFSRPNQVMSRSVIKRWIERDQREAVAVFYGLYERIEDGI